MCPLVRFLRLTKKKLSIRSVPRNLQTSHGTALSTSVCRTGPLRKTNASVVFLISGGKQNQNQPEKPFHCNVCDGTFSRYSSLWSHKRLHSGDKPFKCEVCGLAFAKGKGSVYKLFAILHLFSFLHTSCSLVANFY